MSKPRLKPHLVLDIQCDEYGKYVAFLAKIGSVSETLLETTPCQSKDIALRWLAQKILEMPRVVPGTPYYDQWLEHLSESDRLILAPHLRQNAKEIIEHMSAAIRRIDALMAPE